MNGYSKLSETCLVACEYSQVCGIDFSKNYSLVVNNISFCIPLLVVIHFGFSAKTIDMEPVFLCGDSEGEKYIWNIPKVCQTQDKMSALF